MGSVKKSAKGYTAFWREDGLARRKTFEGSLAFTEAHRYLRERELEQGIVSRPPIQQNLFSREEKSTKNLLPTVEEPDIPFNGREKKTNTGYRNIYYSEKGGAHYGVSVMDLKNKKRIARKVFIKSHGSKEAAFAFAKKCRDEILFRNKELGASQ